MTLKVVTPTLTVRAALLVSAFLLVIYSALSVTTETALRSSSDLQVNVRNVVTAVESKGVIIKDSLTKNLATSAAPASRASASRAPASEQSRVPQEVAVLAEIDTAQILDSAAVGRAARASEPVLPKASKRTTTKAATNSNTDKGWPDAPKVVAPEAPAADHGKSKNEGHGAKGSKGRGKPS